MRALRIPLAALFVLALGAFALGGAPALAQGKDKPTKDDYELDPSATTGTLKVGESGTFSLVIRAKNGTKIHPQAPLEVKLKDGAGLKVEKEKLGRGDVKNKGEPAPELRTSLVAVTSGNHTVEADVSFFLCTDAWCQRVSDRVAVGVQVE